MPALINARSREVEAFFDRHASSYRGRPGGMQLLHRVTAQRIESDLSGTVLAVGGLWPQATCLGGAEGVAVCDLSMAMLRSWREITPRGVQGDARWLPFADAAFDHVVLPLVLHHVAGRTADEARHLAGVVVREAARVLKPAGRLWISEICPSPCGYRWERRLAPLTRRLLGWVGQPLVVLHSAEFYLSILDRERWAEVGATSITAEGAGPWDLVQPVIALPWLRVPRLVFPVQPKLVTARRK
jgi:SAM-dependent methyltransferase